MTTESIESNEDRYQLSPLQLSLLGDHASPGLGSDSAQRSARLAQRGGDIQLPVQITDYLRGSDPVELKLYRIANRQPVSSGHIRQH
jgi:hypothetical protein